MKTLRVLHSDSPPISVSDRKAKELLKTGRYVEWSAKHKSGQGRGTGLFYSRSGQYTAAYPHGGRRCVPAGVLHFLDADHPPDRQGSFLPGR